MFRQRVGRGVSQVVVGPFFGYQTCLIFFPVLTAYSEFRLRPPSGPRLGPEAGDQWDTVLEA